MTRKYLGWWPLLGVGAAACAVSCADDFNAIGDAEIGSGGSGARGGSGSLGGSGGKGAGGASSGAGGASSSAGGASSSAGGASSSAGGGGGTGLGSAAGFGGSTGDAGFGGTGSGGTGTSTSGTGGASTGGVGGTGNDGSAGDDGMGSGGYCNPMPIMEASCSGIVCHGNPGRPSPYITDLLNTPAQALVDQPANYGLVPDPEPCPTTDPERLIDSRAPEQSLILTKILGTSACGVSMPNAPGRELTQAEIDCFADWINGVLANYEDTGSGGATGSTTSTTGVLEIPATFATVVDTIANSSISCSGSDCHGGFEGRLDLRPDAALYDRLLAWDSEVCGNPVVTPGEPDESALVQVLTTGCGDLSPGCEVGTECIPRMPLNCVEGYDCVPPERIEAIRRWIESGAPPE